MLFRVAILTTCKCNILPVIMLFGKLTEISTIYNLKTSTVDLTTPVIKTAFFGQRIFNDKKIRGSKETTEIYLY